MEKENDAIVENVLEDNIENKANNVVIDESLDFALENQKDWFYKTSGLMIK